MIITRTPVRISFFGGGTDYPAYFRRHGGATLATAIDKYVYVTVHHLTEYFEHNLQVHYSKVESVHSVDDLEIPNVREALRLLGFEHGVEVHLVGDLPARSGLGTSSATTVGLLAALYGHQGRLAAPRDLARQAVHIEQEILGERVGSQDQYSCALGGLQHLEFLPDGEVRATPVPLSEHRARELDDHLLMFYTGQQRTAHDVLTEQVERTGQGQLDDRLAAMRAHVARGIEILCGPAAIAGFGDLLHDAWQLKRTLSSRITRPEIDELYARARSAGALGGKLLGAGAGGFMLLFVPPERQPAVREALHHVKEVPFRLEPGGSAVVFYQPGANGAHRAARP
jgi:D-glycero-alpha-D-manno-heptose-7-phosphate kinase